MSPFSHKEIVLTSSPDGPITAYNPSNGATIAHFSGSKSPHNGLTIITQKNLIAASHVSSTSGFGSIHLYNWWTSTPFHHIPVPEPVAPILTAQNGDYIFAGGIFGNIHVLSLPSGDLIQSFPAHSKPVTCFVLNQDGSLLVSGSDDGTIAVISIYSLLDSKNLVQNKRPILHRFVGHESSVTNITIGMSIVISCSLDCTCKFWNLMQGTHLYTVSFPCPVFGVVMDALESEFYVGGADGSVYNGGLTGTTYGRKWVQKQSGAIMGLEMINGGRNLISGSEDGSVCVWEVERGEVIRVVGGEGGGGGGISGMVVAKGFGEFGGDSWGGFSRMGLGLCSEDQVKRPVKEVMEMEGVLKGVVEDRSRAITNLESAIGVYEKLLELIFKEAKAGTKCDGGDDERDDE